MEERQSRHQSRKKKVVNRNNELLCTFATSFAPEPQTVSGQQQSSNTAHNIQTTRPRGRLCRACRFKAGHMKLSGLLRIYLPVIFPTLKCATEITQTWSQGVCRLITVKCQINPARYVQSQIQFSQVMKSKARNWRRSLSSCMCWEIILNSASFMQ